MLTDFSLDSSNNKFRQRFNLSPPLCYHNACRLCRLKAATCVITRNRCTRSQTWTCNWTKSTLCACVCHCKEDIYNTVSCSYSCDRWPRHTRCRCSYSGRCSMIDCSCHHVHSDSENTYKTEKKCFFLFAEHSQTNLSLTCFLNLITDQGMDGKNGFCEVRSHFSSATAVMLHWGIVLSITKCINTFAMWSGHIPTPM